MENATDALKMAFAIFVFVMALSIVFSLISKIKETAEIVIANTDDTNYYEWMKGDLKHGRDVGAETVTAAIYNCKKDLTYVTVTKEGETKIFLPSSTEEEISEGIKTYMNAGGKYKERVVEVTTGGEYIMADDGTKLTETPGKTKVYIIFQKIK